MAIFKCKICGGTLEIDGTQSVATCEYCGTKQTLPKLDDERKANLYDRANHFRRNNDFDKAMSIYEQILNEDNTDAESYWSILLCRYGIEYVEDPATHKRVPTVNRAQYTSIFDDEDYKSALQYADSYQRGIYESEANAINEIQKNILAISQKEEPFDMFICYKETDVGGRRTQDSVLATELYHELTREGFKVFFSRITLEDKLGQEYEPYIFAALNSAKVMVVLGTKPEHFNAVWVKNEWSRYLALIKNGAKKTLIPAYRDMDPYDLPEEFSHLQAQDMSKLGFMQDLTRGIKKIVEAGATQATVKENVVTSSAAPNIAPLLKRAFMFLEDGEFDRANDFCEQVLNQDPENAEAYLGKLMAELCVKRKDELVNCSEPFDDNKNYQKASRFGDIKLRNELYGYILTICERNENKRLENIYNEALQNLGLAKREEEFLAVHKQFNEILSYKDSAELAQQCLEKAHIAKEKKLLDKKAKIYFEAKDNMQKAEEYKNVDRYNDAIRLLSSIKDYKDSEYLISVCQSKLDEQAAREKHLHKIYKKACLIATSIIIFILIFVIILYVVIIPNGKYNDAVSLMKEGSYEDAYKLLQELGDYKDGPNKIKEIENISPSTPFNLCQVGDTITFGQYEQDGNTSNGKEDIKWKVLKIENGRVLIISEVCLESKNIHPSDVNVTWETSSIRQWLNNDFLKSFSSTQKSIIKKSRISNDTYILNSDSGNDTDDYVFLLSVDEAQIYFESDDARRAAFSKQASANKDESSWWLRTKGEGYLSATFVMMSGKISTHGVNYWGHEYGIRPAMWIDVSNIE